MSRDRRKIQLFKADEVPDGYGGFIPGETLYWEPYAEVMPLKAKRDLEANQAVLKGGYIFKVRYRPDKEVTTDLILKYRGEGLVIHGAVNEKDEDKYWLITALKSEN